MLFIDNKDSAFCILSYPHMLKIIDLPFSSMNFFKINLFCLTGRIGNDKALFVCFCCHFGLCFVASDVLTTICHLVIVNVCDYHFIYR